MMKQPALPEKRKPGRPKKDISPDATSDTRKVILHEAKRLFRQSGYAAVSINAIVEAAGITKPTLYYYFEDKEALYTAFLCEMLRNGNQYIAASLKEKDSVREKLLYLALGYFRNSPTSISVVIRDALENLDEAHARQVCQAHQDYIVMPFADMLKAGHERGEIKAHDTMLMAHLLVSLLDTLLISCTVGFSREFPFEQAAETMINSFMDGIAQN